VLVVFAACNRRIESDHFKQILHRLILTFLFHRVNHWTMESARSATRCTISRRNATRSGSITSRLLGTIFVRSGRKRGHPRRPPTPPDVQFRIRRFMKPARSAAEHPAAKPVPCGRTKTSGRRRACAMRPVPPRTSSVGGRLPPPRFTQPGPHQILRPCVIAFSLPPQQRPQLMSDPAIEFFQHTFDRGEPEVGHPSPQQRVQVFDHLFQTSPSSCPQHLAHFLRKSLSAWFRDPSASAPGATSCCSPETSAATVAPLRSCPR